MSIKKMLLCAIVFILAAGLVPGVLAAESGEMKLGVNDRVTDIRAVSVEYTFYVPVRVLAEELRLNLGGTPEDLLLSGETGSLRILKKGKMIAGDGTEWSLTAFNRGGRLMVPLRIVTLFGYSVSYNPGKYLLRITDGNQTLDDNAFAEKFKDKLKPEEPPLPAAPQSAKPAPNPAKPGPSGKIVYLTFDDGPSATTGRLLDILDKHGAKATFFMLGPNIERYPGVVKRMAKSGHGLGLHGVTHVKSKFYASPAAALKEMNQDNADLKAVTGRSTKLIRTPYGSKPYFTKAYRDKVLGGGYRLWDWNVDSLDWKYKSASDLIYNNVVSQVNKMDKHGVRPIILMHDQKATLQVLPRILNYLHKKGYQYEIITSDLQPVNFWHDAR
ncbi:peptidoglycan/xylan/chitin deacetylase (PgdA/CDA1 family) [Paenibacillus forsythiae]|uniref:Peptidoglycan/xylan/chitin deacetylase (PgdA/CDA1 family) n=1 Tax=Paenibacillus forsythiae TaxID=365616 RepID=A0ABU3H8R5_9BACL|nr:polysaccharide deacetylase [Paenibacillus forsythiae]MDT3427115.1 peptidoglycan/xylan/chitin deacetylase (PgdA/CDA1 family) [Paenibacillus forsythiae]